VVTIPANQSQIAGVLEKKFQGCGFNMAIAKDHVGFALMAGIGADGAAEKR
jgi:hypothetical protein